MSWTKKEIQIFAEGLAVGGKYNLSSVSGYKPEVWNDAGIYSYFYINFHRVISDFSPAQFTECVMVQGNSGLLPITNVEKISPMVAKVYCNIDGQTSGIQVYGKSGSWLLFANGKVVPAFTATMTVAGLSTAIALAYVYETVVSDYLSRIVKTDSKSIIMDIYRTSSANDSLLIKSPFFCSLAFDEDVLVTYS